jgi:hypothetical protein
VNPVFILSALLIAAILFTLLAIVTTLGYRITEAALEVRVLGMLIRRVPLADIEEVHRRGAFLRESWSGFKFWNAVIIRRRRGWLKNLAVSPDDPDRFVEELRAAIGRSSAGAAD